jgi:hypothetical protein
MSLGWSRSGGGPAPAGNGSKPVHSCDCGAMFTGGKHVCRTTAQTTTAEAAGRESDREAGG